MKDFALDAIIREGFTVAVKNSEPMCLKITGNADMEMVPLFAPYLLQLHKGLCDVGARTVLVDLRDLYFMNSSCIKALLTWIAAVKKLTPIEKYQVQFLTNPKQHWQKRSLRAIQDFAPSIVIVVEE